MRVRYDRVQVAAFGYELGPVVVSTAELEEQLGGVYSRLGLQAGQLEAWTGISERRWWEPQPSLSSFAATAARKALAKAGLQATDIGALVYTGVCRENFEPATACAVASNLGLRGNVALYDISNACLGVLNGIVDIANRIQLGQIRAGLVVSCETAREINQIAALQLAACSSMDEFSKIIATFTGGSGAVAVLLTDGSFPGLTGRRLLGAVSEIAPEHHQLCRWGIEDLSAGQYRQFMTTDSIGVLRNGVQLGITTWQALLTHLSWNPESIDRVICHQVGSAHQDSILKTLGIPREKDFATYRYLGNMGTVALPTAAAIAEERGILKPGNRVAFLGIGSGLTCLMMGLEW